MPEDQDIDSTIANRRIAMMRASAAASAGDSLAGSLADLENIASPFFLGLDTDEDNTDLDVYP